MGAPSIKSSPPAVVLICGVKIRFRGDVEFAATKKPCPGAMYISSLVLLYAWQPLLSAFQAYIAPKFPVLIVPAFKLRFKKLSVSRS